LEGITHSTESEKRYFCLGEVSEGVLTVRFTYRERCIRIFGAGYWQKGKRICEEKISYSDGPIGGVKVVKDFLPPPEDLACEKKR
jgi:hypothetical protein